MLFDEQRVNAEAVAIRIDTEAALRHANAIREQHGHRRRTLSPQWALNPARRLIAAIAATRQRTPGNVPPSRSQSASGQTAAPLTLPRRIGIPGADT